MYINLNIYQYIFSKLFFSSSVVERSAVNRLVVGSNPTWGDLKENLLNLVKKKKIK